MTTFDLLTAPPMTTPAVLVLAKATVLLFAAFGATVIMQRTTAGTRHLVWLVAVSALLVLPALVAWSPLRIPMLSNAMSASVDRASRIAVDAFAPPAITVGVRQTTSAAADRAAVSTTSTATPERHWWSPVMARLTTLPLTPFRTVVALWIAVALALVGRLAFGVLSVRRIVRRARPLVTADWTHPLLEVSDRLGLADAPRLLRTNDATMPFACGLFRPTIVLPADCDDWTPDRRHAVLLHELGHVRRRDLIGHTLGRLACAFYWFHPLVWTAARRLRAESERACDDLAITSGARASDYAEHLLDIVSAVRHRATPVAALAMAHRREFEGRMLAILDPRLHRATPKRARSVAFAGVLATLALLVGAAAPAPAAARILPDGGLAVAPIDSTTGERNTPQSPAVNDSTGRRRNRTPSSSASPSAAPSPSPSPEAHIELNPNPMPANDALAIAQGTQGRSDERATLLANILRTDTSARIRRVAAWGLSQYAEEDVAVEALTRAVRRDASVGVREMSAWALGNGGPSDRKAADALLEAVRRDTSAKVRGTAIWALANVGEGSDADGIAEFLSSDEAGVRMRAAWAIGQLGPSHAPKQLIAALSDKEASVRLIVAWALFEIEDEDAAGPLDAAFTREKVKEVQQGLLKALLSKRTASVEHIKKLLDSNDEQVRSDAITALAGGQGMGSLAVALARPAAPTLTSR